MNAANLLQISDAAIREIPDVLAIATVLAIAALAQVFAQNAFRVKLARSVSK